MSDNFIARNSKNQVLILVVPAIAFLILIVVMISTEMDLFIRIPFIGLFASAIIGLTITVCYFFFQPEIAIEATNDEIIFYKRNEIFKYNIEDIVKVLINVGWGSFDIYIYIRGIRRKGFHFLIINSGKKKRECMRYFESKGIKVVKYDISG